MADDPLARAELAMMRGQQAAVEVGGKVDQATGLAQGTGRS